MNRVQQVNWLRELASDITCCVWQGEYTGAEIVAYSLDEAEDAIALPDWFDDHDRRLLVQFTDEALAN